MPAFYSNPPILVDLIIHKTKNDDSDTVYRMVGTGGKTIELGTELVVKLTMNSPTPALHGTVIWNYLQNIPEYTIISILLPFPKDWQGIDRYSTRPAKGFPGWVFINTRDPDWLPLGGSLKTGPESVPYSPPTRLIRVELEDSGEIKERKEEARYLASDLRIPTRKMVKLLQKEPHVIEESLQTAKPSYTLRLLSKGIELKSVTTKISNKDRKEFHRIAEKIGVKTDYLIRVLRGKGRTVKGEFRPYRLSATAEKKLLALR